jgi:hypothetical protein
MSPKEIEMTHDELLARIDNPDAWDSDGWGYLQKALRAVVELHEPEQITATFSVCSGCYEEESGPSEYPCPTIQVIDKELA